MRIYASTMVDEELASYKGWLRGMSTPSLENHIEDLRYKVNNLTAPGGRVDAYEKSIAHRVELAGGKAKLTQDQKDFIAEENRRMGELVANTKKELALAEHERKGRLQGVTKAGRVSNNPVK